MPSNLKTELIFLVVVATLHNGYCVKYSILGGNDWLSAIFYLDI